MDKDAVDDDRVGTVFLDFNEVCAGGHTPRQHVAAPPPALHMTLTHPHACIRTHTAAWRAPQRGAPVVQRVRAEQRLQGLLQKEALQALPAVPGLGAQLPRASAAGGAARQGQAAEGAAGACVRGRGLWSLKSGHVAGGGGGWVGVACSSHARPLPMLHMDRVCVPSFSTDAHSYACALTPTPQEVHKKVMRPLSESLMPKERVFEFRALVVSGAELPSEKYDAHMHRTALTCTHTHATRGTHTVAHTHTHNGSHVRRASCGHHCWLCAGAWASSLLAASTSLPLIVSRRSAASRRGEASSGSVRAVCVLRARWCAVQASHTHSDALPPAPRLNSPQSPTSRTWPRFRTCSCT